tara:strand:- start:26 stop:655 length:630 start_codon:yes stop_codon:yes gene_type:complete
MAIDNPKSEDALYFAKPVISRGLFPAMVASKNEDKLGKVSASMDAWRKENGYEMDRDLLEHRIACSRAKVTQWSSVLQLIDLPDMKSNIINGVGWLIEQNENPVHSEQSIRDWMKTVQKRLDKDEARAYAIKMLDQKAKNRAGDWLKYGKQAGELLTRVYFSDHETDYPEDVIFVVAKRLGHMIEHCHRYPRIERAAALDEMEDLLATC